MPTLHKNFFIPFWHSESDILYMGQNTPSQTLFHKICPIELNFFLYDRFMGRKKSIKFLAQKSKGCPRYRVSKFWVLAKGAYT